jgi:hypothetical protein
VTRSATRPQWWWPTRFREAIRTGDTVGRVGGDEFIVICPDLPSGEAALPVARRVSESLRTSLGFADAEIQMGASVGIAWTDVPSTPLSLAPIARCTNPSAEETAWSPWPPAVALDLLGTIIRVDARWSFLSHIASPEASGMSGSQFKRRMRRP